jgi:hypothetical protein
MEKTLLQQRIEDTITHYHGYENFADAVAIVNEQYSGNHLFEVSAQSNDFDHYRGPAVTLLDIITNGLVPINLREPNEENLRIEEEHSLRPTNPCGEIPLGSTSATRIPLPSRPSSNLKRVIYYAQGKIGHSDILFNAPIPQRVEEFQYI